VEFKPKSNGPKKGALEINDSDPSSPQIVGMTGTGTSSVALNPGSVAFAAQAVNTTSSLTKITLANNTVTSLTLKSPALSISGPFSIGTGVTTCTAKAVIAAGQTCVIWVNFTPTAVGYPTGTLSVFDSDASSPQTVSLTGVGTGVSFSPTAVTVPPTNVGVEGSATASITNVGTTTITFTAATITGTNFKDFSTSASNPPCGGSLAPGAVCTFTVYCTPSIVGSESATYVVYDSSTGSPQSLALNGTRV
jgi:hypothetical protein